jgi:hypothetical protein
MPRVLIVSYRWLPGAHASARQVAALCRHLPAAGWDPHVLSRDWSEESDGDEPRPLDEQDVADSPTMRAAMQLPVVRVAPVRREGTLRRWHRALHDDRELASGARESLREVGRRALDTLYPLFGVYPDAQRDWVDPTVEAGMAAVRKYGISAVVSAGPPTSAHIAGGEIARAAAVPWVLLATGLGELFTNSTDGRTAAHRLQLRTLAKGWLRGASRVAAATPAIAAHLAEQYDLAGEVVVSPFDPDDRRVAPHRVAGAPLRVVHSGPLSAERHRIDVLLDALDLLLAEDPARRDRLRVEIVDSGSGDALLDRAGERLAASVLSLRGTAALADARTAEREADVLLLFDEDDPGAPGVSSLRAAPRLFELLHARRPLVAVVGESEGQVASVLSETGAGEAVDSAVALAAVLRGMVEQVVAGGAIEFRGDDQAIAAYSSPEQAKRLALLLDQAAGERFGRWQRA